LVVAGVLLVACSRTPTPQTAAIVIDKMAYGPAPAHLNEGDQLQWSNHDILHHTATARDGSFDVDLAPGATKSVTLAHAGAIDVYCRYHPGMTMRLMVEPKG
jgi:plastocyanin